MGEKKKHFPEGGNNLAPTQTQDLSGRCHGDQQNSSHSCLRHACTQTPHNSHNPFLLSFTHTEVMHVHEKNHSTLTVTFFTIAILGLAQALVASLPRMKGPALLALLPDIPGHCSLLALPDVSPAPLSDERRLDILELYGGIYLISTRDKDKESQVKG